MMSNCRVLGEGTVRRATVVMKEHDDEPDWFTVLGVVRSLWLLR